jgi:predicted exporter
VLVALSLLVGCAAALSVTAWVFGQVHLITLVFGASLVGVAEDYGIHYFASRQGQPWAQPRGLLRELLPGLLLALLTSVLAYLAMGMAPFPGLRQMAVFSSVGLLAAMLTVVCWFPWLDRGVVGSSRFAVAVSASLQRWPRLAVSGRACAVYAVLAVLCALGLMQLRTNDDVRQLQNSPPELLASQRQLSSLLGVASPAQFFLVRGAGAEELLQREEALKGRLDALVREGRLAGYSAVSDWVPSAARQRADAALTAKVEAEVLGRVNAALGESLARPAFASEPLTVQRWLDHPVSTAARGLWLGKIHGAQASVVMLRGLHDAALLPSLAAAAQGLEGVRWVDKPAEISSLLGRYRVSMSWLLLLGHAVVLAALWWRFGRAAWRAWLPTALASVGALAVLGAIGQPLQLFTVLALLLLLGVGSDYGIFLLEHVGDGSAWLAVALGAGSTWLAFGLLGLSSTPALRAFGLTLLFGLAMVAMLAPMLRPAAAANATS